MGLQGGGQGGTGSVSFDQSKEKGAFASVAEQSGIMAGSGGFDIRVAGNTDLKGAVIASSADAAKNTLVTGTLSASDITNTERYKASQIGISAGIAGIGADKNATPPPQNTGNDGQPDASVGSGGTKIPGIKTGIGTISAGAPGFLSASGSQSGTTNAAIAPATIIITTGPLGAQDAASQAIANTISRDTANANAGALTQEFDAAKRAEVQAGFEAAKALTQQTAVFFANRAAEEKAAKDEAKALEQKLAAAGAVRTDANGNALRDDRGNLVTIGTLSPEAAAAVTLADTRNADAKSLNDTFGAGSPARILATAFSGAAGSNVAGSLGGLAQSAAVNVLQSLAVTQVKQIANSLGSDANKDGILDKPTATTETVRAALQAVTGCAGAAAGGSGNCGSAAIGASASVVLNYLLTTFIDPKTIDPLTGKEIPRTLEDQQARSDLIATFIGTITAAAGLDASSAVSAAQIETQNNDLATKSGVVVPTGNSGGYTVAETGKKIAELKAKTNLTDEEKALLQSLSKNYDALLKDHETEEAAQNAVNADVALGTANASDIAFAGSKAELKEFFLKGGTLDDLRAEKRAYVDAYVSSSIDSFDLSADQRAALKAEYAAGGKASDIYIKAYEQSVGSVNAAIGNFASTNRDELEFAQFILNQLPASKAAIIVTTGVDIGLDVKNQNDLDKVYTASEIAEQSATLAVAEQRQARYIAAGGDPNVLRIETVNGKKVFVGKPPLGDPKAGTNPHFNDPKHKVGFDGEVRLAQNIHNKVPGQVVVSYGNGPGIKGADVITVDANGNVYLYDNRVRNSGVAASGVPQTAIQDSSALGPNKDGILTARDKAMVDIDASNLPPDIKAKAEQNLKLGNYFARTAGDGTGARNSTLTVYREGKPAPAEPAFPTTRPRPSGQDSVTPQTLPKGR